MMKNLFFAVALAGAMVACQSGPAAGWEDALRSDLENMADELTRTVTPWEIPDRVFDIRDFGAVGDSSTLNTEAIQWAIDSCSAAGGGVVLVDGGNYVTGTVELKSNVMLEVAERSRLLGSTSIADYPDRVEGRRSVMRDILRYRISLIYAEKAENIGIRGKGEIYFRGEKENFPGPETAVEIEGRPFGIRIVDCKNIFLYEISLRSSAAWMQSYLACDNLLVDGIKVENHANYNNDGLDIDGCHNVIVRNCFINAEDDAVCMKGGSSRTSENILIENNTLYSTCNALKIGTDSQDEFKNILVRNLVLSGVPEDMYSFAGHECSTGVTMTTVDGTTISHVLVTDVEIYQARCPIFLKIGQRGRVLPEIEKPAPGKITHILVENVTGERNLRQGSFISGVAGYPVENVTIRNMNISMVGGGDESLADAPVNLDETSYSDAHQFSRDGLPAYGFYFRFAKNITLDNVTIMPENPDNRPFVAVGPETGNIMVNGEKL